MTELGKDHIRIHHIGDDDDDVFEQLREELRPVDPREMNPRFEFMKLSRRVCLIERDDATEATGCLVGPDLMLTTAHALMGTKGIFADPDHVTVKFDQFIWNEKTHTRARGDQCKLRHIPFTDQPDVVASSIKTDPRCRRRYDDNGLDYVLVRLDRPMGLSFLPYSHRIRGWNNSSRADVPAEGKVFVVQHPLARISHPLTGIVGRLLLVESPSPPRFSAGEKVPKADEGAVALAEEWIIFMNGRAVNR